MKRFPCSRAADFGLYSNARERVDQMNDWHVLVERLRSQVREPSGRNETNLNALAETLELIKNTAINVSFPTRELVIESGYYVLLRDVFKDLIYGGECQSLAFELIVLTIEMYQEISGILFDEFLVSRMRCFVVYRKHMRGRMCELGPYLVLRGLYALAKTIEGVDIVLSCADTGKSFFDLYVELLEERLMDTESTMIAVETEKLMYLFFGTLCRWASMEIVERILYIYGHVLDVRGAAYSHEVYSGVHRVWKTRGEVRESIVGQENIVKYACMMINDRLCPPVNALIPLLRLLRGIVRKRPAVVTEISGKCIWNIIEEFSVDKVCQIADFALMLFADIIDISPDAMYTVDMNRLVEFCLSQISDEMVCFRRKDCVDRVTLVFLAICADVVPEIDMFHHAFELAHCWKRHALHIGCNAAASVLRSGREIGQPLRQSISGFLDVCVNSGWEDLCVKSVNIIHAYPALT